MSLKKKENLGETLTLELISKFTTNEILSLVKSKSSIPDQFNVKRWNQKNNIILKHLSRMKIKFDRKKKEEEVAKIIQF